MMTQAEFHNALRLLRFVEPEEINPDNLGAVAAFESNPYNFFIRCDQPTRDRIWAAMELDNKPTPVRNASSNLGASSPGSLSP